SILGYRPRSHVVILPGDGRDPFTQLSQLIPTGGGHEADVARQFARSHVGMVAYDAVHHTTKVDPWPNDSSPLARLVGNATVVVFDNLTHTATIAAADQGDLERAEADLATVASLSPLPPPDP